MKVHELYDKETTTIYSYLTKCDVKDVEEYLSPTGKYIEDWHEYKDIPYAIKEIEYWSKLDSKIFIIQDGDVDGICSTVILYQYLAKLSDKWSIQILIHDGKQRGLDDENIMNKIRIGRPDLVIVPDAGTNNKEQAEELCELGIGLIVLDHHDYSTPIEKGYLINNQNVEYNVSRNGSGTLVTHKFLQGLDDYFDKDWSKYFIDLVALSLVSDSMNMSEMENREYYHFGLETNDCIMNQFLYAMFEKFIGDKSYTQRDIGFKIIPKLNAVCRCTDMTNKQRIILALIGQDDINEVLDIIEQAHKDQIDIVNGVIEANIGKIEEITDNNLIIFASDDIPRSYSGLLAGKIKTMCNNKPTIVGSVKDGYMIGSLRSPIPLRSELAENELVDFAQGHEDSCGVGIYVDNIQSLVDYYNSLELSYTPQIDVLKSYSIKSLPSKLFGLFEPYNALWGCKILQPQYCINNIIYNPNDIIVLGKNKSTLKLHTEGIDIMFFFCTKADKEKIGVGYVKNSVFTYKPINKKMKLSIICTLNVNNWNGNKTNQCIVSQFEVYEIKKKEKSDIF